MPRHARTTSFGRSLKGRREKEKVERRRQRRKRRKKDEEGGAGRGIRGGLGAGGTGRGGGREGRGGGKEADIVSHSLSKSIFKGFKCLTLTL